MTNPDWRPRATLDTLQARAALYARLRQFFAERAVLEVDTPLISATATVDPNIESWRVESASFGARWLTTSPEFPMKRLLAAGSGPIYQLGHVFREGEAGRLHNPEFTLLEWYRPGFSLDDLMNEVEALVSAELPADFTGREHLSYRDAFIREAGVDPFTADIATLRRSLVVHQLAEPERLGAAEETDRDFWLDLLMGGVVGPKLGAGGLCFIYDYPASQAALARVRSESPPVAERFELYCQGIELANGFAELDNAGEQRRRFEANQQQRRQRGQAVPPFDENLLAALEAGLPTCAGVALGVDRLLMLSLGLDSVAETQAFPFDRA